MPMTEVGGGVISIGNSTVESAIWGLIARVTGTGNANCTGLRLVQFHALPVPVNRAINPILHSQPCY